MSKMSRSKMWERLWKRFQFRSVVSWEGMDFEIVKTIACEEYDDEHVTGAYGWRIFQILKRWLRN